MVRPNFKGLNNPNHRHGMSYAGKRHPLDTCYYNMWSRCYNPKNEKYHRYGGRGIIITDSWHNKINFFTWAFLNGWEQGLTIDRKDNDQIYCPENCQWIKMGPNSQKKSTTKLSFLNAETIRKRVINGESEYELAKEYGVVHGTIWFIINNDTHNY